MSRIVDPDMARPFPIHGPSPSFSDAPEPSPKDGSISHPFGTLDIPALTRAIQRGDQAAFERIYRAIFAPLYRYLLVRSGGREQDSQEALQETLLRVARHMKRFDGPVDLWNWIRCIARNILIDQGRKARRQPLSLRLVPEVDPIQAPDEREDLLELTRHLDHCLEKLDPAERSLVRGRYLEAKGHAALALEHGLSPKAVESRLARIRRKLKSLMIERLAR